MKDKFLKEKLMLKLHKLKKPKTDGLYYDVFGGINQYGVKIFFFAQASNGHNNADIYNGDFYYYDEEFAMLKTVQKTYLYKNMFLSKKFLNADGSHKYIPKGERVSFLFVGTIYK